MKARPQQIAHEVYASSSVSYKSPFLSADSSLNLLGGSRPKTNISSDPALCDRTSMRSGIVSEPCMRSFLPLLTASWPEKSVE